MTQEPAPVLRHCPNEGFSFPFNNSKFKRDKNSFKALLVF